MSLRTRGVVVCPLLVGGLLACGLLTGCEPGDVAIDSPSLGTTQRAACERILAHLPGTLAGEPRRTVSPADALGAAWGDPAIVLTCGVGVPEEFDELSTCVEANGVDWFVPAGQVADDSLDVTFSTAGYRPVVELLVPAEYRPEGGAAAIAELAEALEGELENVQPCG